MSVLTTSVGKTPVSYTLANRRFIDEQLWERLIERIVKDESMERPLAERIMDQALAFLILCVKSPQGGYSPSPLVDIGWHMFILYTKPYASWCKKQLRRHFWSELRRPANWLRLGRLWRLFRRTFIHHNPSDVPGVDYGKGNIARTVDALRRVGLFVDEPLWATTGRCSDCKSPIPPTRCEY